MHPHSASTTRRSTVVATLIALVGVGMFAALAWCDAVSGSGQPAIALATIAASAALAFDAMPRTWVRIGPSDVVSPSWMFVVGVMLVAPPTLAALLAAVGAAIRSRADRAPTALLVTRLGGALLSTATAGLVLGLASSDRPITAPAAIPWRSAAGIVVAGLLLLLLNAVTTALWASAMRNISYLTVLRRRLAARITAEGALVSLAPIWVVTLDYSPVLGPLLAITTVLVFRAASASLQHQHGARFDPLTGLRNRHAFAIEVADDLAQCGRSGARPAVLVMDLDGFKTINDELGHQLGDALLIAFARRLETSIPPGASAARLGGDEFAVRWYTTLTDADIRIAVERLQQALSEPLNLQGFPLSIGASIGAAIAPDDGTSADELLRAADAAMYRSKRTKQGVDFYRNCKPSSQLGRTELLGELHTALDRSELFVVYQPQVAIGSGTVQSVEALVRWQHPEHGVVPPGEFIGLAEQTDLIGAITLHVLRISTQSMMIGEAAKLGLAVNVSARSLADPAFADGVLAVLAESGFAPSRLELEVTERTIRTDDERSSYTIDRLREVGVRFAIDDFGVGHSSYRTLRGLAVDRVKIDREFVEHLLTNERDRMIVDSLVRLAHDLGLDVVAEGVESPMVWEALGRLGCDVAQGFGVAVPMDYAAMRSWLNRWNKVTQTAPGGLGVRANPIATNQSDPSPPPLRHVPRRARSFVPLNR